MIKKIIAAELIENKEIADKVYRMTMKDFGEFLSGSIY